MQRKRCFLEVRAKTKFFHSSLLISTILKEGCPDKWKIIKKHAKYWSNIKMRKGRLQIFPFMWISSNFLRTFHRLNDKKFAVWSKAPGKKFGLNVVGWPQRYQLETQLHLNAPPEVRMEGLCKLPALLKTAATNAPPKREIIRKVCVSDSGQENYSFWRFPFCLFFTFIWIFGTSQRNVFSQNHREKKLSFPRSLE